MKKLIIIAAIAVFCGAVFNAALGESAAHELSLQDALQRAVRDNPLVRIERINTDIAASILRDQRSPYEPHLRAGYRTGHSDNRQFSESHDLSASVSQNFSTGTGVEAGVSASPYSSLRRPDDTFQNNIGLTVTQALLQGLGSEANLVPLRKARIDLDIRQEELAAYTQRLIADTERAYWDLLLSGEQTAIFRYSLELAQRLLFESEERLRIGGIAPIDLVAIRAEVASRERQLFDAETAYRQRALYLKFLMNAPELWDVEIVITDTSAQLGTADSVSEHIEAAHVFRPDYLMAFMQVQKGELDLVQTKNGLLPRLDFFISLQGTTYAESFPRALLPGDMSGAVAGGLTLQFPIRNTPARERHRRIEYTVEQQRLAVENFARLIEYEIRSAHMEVLRAKRQIETSETVSALQLQKLEAEQAKMNAGKSTGYAVLQVQRDLVSANLDEAQARTAYVNALIALYSRDGTLLQRRGINIR
ncbi:MAG: TolC family protein [Chitinispirillales bacterium]|nr:TolC family protein [Chitinispirillales bacterium]